MTKNDIKDFMRNYEKWEIIRLEITDIALEYMDKRAFYTPKGVHVNLSDNEIIVTLDAGGVPFKLINALNIHCGVNCEKITVNVGHHINLHYKF